MNKVIFSNTGRIRLSMPIYQFKLLSKIMSKKFATPKNALPIQN